MKSEIGNRKSEIGERVVAGFCGAVWGAALARTLALEFHSAFFFGMGGALAGALLGLGGVLLLIWRTRRTAVDLLPLLLPLADLLGGDFHPWRSPVLLLGSLTLTLLLFHAKAQSRQETNRSPAPPLPHSPFLLLAVLLPLAVYLPDLSPYVGRADTFEFQVVAPRLGIAHPSGYPLYILLGKLFSLLPFGSPAWRVNLSSAICASLASGMLFLALQEASQRVSGSANQRISEKARKRINGSAGQRTTQPSALSPQPSVLSPQSSVLSTQSSPLSPQSSLLAALTLAFSPALWARAIEAEVYALNALLVALGLWLAVRWASGKLSPDKALPLFGLLTGVAMASHLTLGALALLALPLLLRRPRPAWRAWLWGLGLGLAGLALYLYIPLRWPAVTGDWMSPGAFIRFVLNADSGGALRPLAFWQDPARWGLVLERVRAQIGWAGLALALLGWLRLLRRQWSLALGSLLAGSAWVWFALSFYVADPDYSAFLIPAHVVLIFWMGVGIQGIANSEWRMADEQISESANQRKNGSADRRISEVLSPQSTVLSPQSSALSTQSSVLSPHSSLLTPHSSLLTPLFLVVCALLPLSRLWLTGPTLDTRAQGLADEAWGRYVLRQPLAEGAAILADSEKFPPLYYLQQVAGLRPDLELVTLFSEEQYRADLEARLAAGQRVYLARYLPGLDAFGVTSAGPLVEVAPPASLTESQYAGPIFNDALILAAHHLAADPEGRPLHHLTLTWRILARPDADLTLRLRLRDAEGNVVWEKPAARPVNGYTTTAAWQASQEVQDYHALAWPDWLPGGTYTLEVGVFPRFAEEGWTTEAGQTWYPLETLILPEPRPEPRRSAASGYFSAPALWLEAAALPGEAWAGAPVAVEVQWRGQPAANARPLFRWMPLDATGAECVTGAASTPLPAPGESVRRYRLAAPEATGRYRLNVGWETAGTLSAARCGWLQRTQAFCPLGEITVGPSNAGIANFGDQVLLVDAGFNVDDVPAGGQARVDLRWRSLRVLPRDYTVFVQVVGPDGQLYGQVDSWPVQGTRPTSGWRVGEELDDPYRFYLKEGAPPGEYTVIVGWYLLADMSRLPVLDAEGQARGDFYTVGAFTLGGDSP